MCLTIISNFFGKIFRFLGVMVTFMIDSLNGLLKIYEFNVFCLKCYIFMPVCPQKMGPPNKKNLILYLNEGRISKAGHFSLWDGSHLFWKSGNVHNWPKKWLIFMNASSCCWHIWPQNGSWIEWSHPCGASGTLSDIASGARREDPERYNVYRMVVAAI